MVICFKVLPQGLTKCIERDEARIKDLLLAVRDIIDEDLNLLIIVNGKPIDDPETSVHRGDEIVLVQESLGG